MPLRAIYCLCRPYKDLDGLIRLPRDFKAPKGLAIPTGFRCPVCFSNYQTWGRSDTALNQACLSEGLNGSGSSSNSSSDTGGGGAPSITAGRAALVLSLFVQGHGRSEDSLNTLQAGQKARGWPLRAS